MVGVGGQLLLRLPEHRGGGGGVVVVVVVVIIIIIMPKLVALFKERK
jgi:hypothetical protein